MASNSDVYRVVTNIPNGFDAIDMRNYFSFLTEKNAFNYFHYTRKPETHLMGSVLKIQSVVTQFMKDKGFELSEKNPKKYFTAAEEVFHSAEGSEHEDAVQNGDSVENVVQNGGSATDNLTDSISNLKINGSSSVNGFKDKSDTCPNKFGVSEAIDDEALTERINFMENDLEASVLRDEDYLSQGSSAEEEVKEKKEEEKNEPKLTKNRFCCVVKIKEEYDDFLKKVYHQKFWVNAKGTVLPVRCLILDFDPMQIVLDYIPDGDDSPMKNRTREQIYEEALHYTTCQIKLMEIFKSQDNIMPHGNVGESIKSVEKYLKSYHISADKALFADLGIKFDTNVNVRRFCNVPFYYHPSSDDQEEDGTHDMSKYFPRTLTANGDVIPVHHDFRQINRVDESLSREYQLDYIQNVEYDASAMNWHTYEEFHDAVQDREKSREVQFKEDIRLPVTEEGSGVVQYFDGQFWCQNEGGEEIRALDGWEIKTEVAVFRRRLTKEERADYINDWTKRTGKAWSGQKNDENISDKERADRRFNLSVNPIAPYQVKHHIAGLMLYGKVRDPGVFSFPRAMTRPTEVDKLEVWNKYFEASWKELFKEIVEVKKVLAQKQQAERKERTKQAVVIRKKKVQKKPTTKPNNSKPANKKGLNREILERVQRRFDKEARAHPEWYGNTYRQSGKTPLLPGPFPSHSGRSKPPSQYMQYDAQGYDSYGRSVFDNRLDYYNTPQSVYNNYGLYEKYYGGNNVSEYDRLMECEARYLASQGYSYDSIQTIMNRKYYEHGQGYQGRQDYGQGGYGHDYSKSYRSSKYDRSNRDGDNYSNYKKVSKEKAKQKKEKDSDSEHEEAPTAHYENDGEFTSGVTLVHPKSSCIVKVSDETAT